MPLFKLCIIQGVFYKVKLESEVIIDGVVLLYEYRQGCMDISNSLHHEFILGIDDDSFIMHFVNNVMGPNHKGSFPDIVNRLLHSTLSFR
jgi:hypothetical protein